MISYNKIYSWREAQNILDKYEATSEKTGREYVAYTIPGSLCDGMIITGDGFKTTIIKEVYLNEWSSGISIRMYNNLPKKYENIMEMLDGADYDDEKEMEKITKFFYA